MHAVPSHALMCTAVESIRARAQAAAAKADKAGVLRVMAFQVQLIVIVSRAYQEPFHMSHALVATDCGSKSWS